MIYQQYSHLKKTKTKQLDKFQIESGDDINWKFKMYSLWVAFNKVKSAFSDLQKIKPSLTCKHIKNLSFHMQNHDKKQNQG